MSNIIKIGQQNVSSPVMASYAHGSVSPRYNQVKTIDVINALRDSGWSVTKTATQRVKDESREGFQKHFVWMAPNSGKSLEVGDTEMRLIISNSHDGTSAFRMNAGLHRKVCSNGLIISVGDFSHVSIRHTEEDIEQLAIDGAIRIAALAPQIDEMIKKMTGRPVTEEERALFVRSAIALMWPNKTAQELSESINENKILMPRRFSDRPENAWTLYNTVQENLTKGGILTNTGRRTRAIKSPQKDVSFNADLFELASKLVA